MCLRGKATRGFQRWAERISEIRVGSESFTWSCLAPAGHAEAGGTFYPQSASLRPEFCIFSSRCTTAGTLGRVLLGGVAQEKKA